MKDLTYVSPKDRNYDFWKKIIFPLFRVGIRSGYISFEIKGAENIPRQDNVLYVANHSSWMALDGLLIPYALSQVVGEKALPYGIVHDVLLKLPILGRFYRSCGAVPVSWVRDLRKLPGEIGTFGIFPEGDSGNSKPFWQAYRMKKWKRGFVKLALSRKLTVVPVAVQGMEESMPVVFTLGFLKPLIGTQMGYPFFPFPLPSKIRVTFCEPVDFSKYSEEFLGRLPDAEKIAAEIRQTVQDTLDRETVKRPLAKLSKMISKWSGRSPRGLAGSLVAPRLTPLNPIF